MQLDRYDFKLYGLQNSVKEIPEKLRNHLKDKNQISMKQILIQISHYKKNKI